MNMKFERTNNLGKIDISIIIPAYNEADFILATLKRIRDLMPDFISFELIVVDNCSDDDTGAVVKSFNCHYLLMDEKSNPSAVRNFGAAIAKGSVFIFLDADILITKRWVDELIENLPFLLTGSPLLTGAQCSISEKPNWLEKNWFIQLVNKEPNYINGSNIIIHKKNFKMLKGFDEKLNTSEDVDFSNRARAFGMEVVNNPEYLVHHEGYPKTLAKFVRREMWHGSSDFNSMKRFFSSKTAIAGSLLLFLLCVGVFALIFLSFLIGILIAFSIALFCMFIVYMKFGVLKKRMFLVNTYICFFYLLGRGLSPLHRNS